ncbi:hypothetical protein FHS31_001264 [Sphingomonas vulcanisoli]|uniref:PilZ domain-containing protein n=1 Tax=Sphingomonas vulcanisoli TaxID=1658060 RepID=A0ABX0TRF8_9SPHN|nr:PilZ domain-containing protein [Sphingomonas vulcanisoli]NIJ07668.1 hypothetical protein [Sphingomonas vulcanisoli]
MTDSTSFDSSGVSNDADEARFESLRADQRDSMLLMATLRRANGTDIAIKVRNLSSGGLMAEVPVSLHREESVEVDLRGIGIVPAKVAWAAGGRAGLAFDHAVDHKLARKPVAGGPQPQLVRVSRDMWRPGLR